MDGLLAGRQGKSTQEVDPGGAEMEQAREVRVPNQDEFCFKESGF
jgi:hypothetical protein